MSRLCSVTDWTNLPLYCSSGPNGSERNHHSCGWNPDPSTKHQNTETPALPAETHHQDEEGKSNVSYGASGLAGSALTAANNVLLRKMGFICSDEIQSYDSFFRTKMNHLTFTKGIICIYCKAL